LACCNPRPLTKPSIPILQLRMAQASRLLEELATTAIAAQNNAAETDYYAKDFMAV
jgi:hypothetical protein